MRALNYKRITFAYQRREVSKFSGREKVSLILKEVNFLCVKFVMLWDEISVFGRSGYPIRLACRWLQPVNAERRI